MIKIKSYLKDVLYFFTILFLVLMLLTFLNYINLIDYKIVSIISFIVTILLFLITSIRVARKSERKGYQNGLIISLINIFFFILLSVIFNAKMNLSVIIYYFLLMISGILGGMIGINLKSRK